MASSNFIPEAVASTAVSPPAAPPNAYQPSSTFTPPAGTAGQQQQSSGGNGLTNFLPSNPISGITSGIDKIGGAIGFGTPTTVGGSTGMAGVVVPGSTTAGSISAAPLSGVLAGAGIGGLVGSINPLAGGTTAGSVGGMAGGMIAAGAGFGPIGMAVGGFLGSSLGGVFGKKKPGVKASEFQTTAGEGNDFLKNTGYGSKRADKSQAEQVHGDFTGYLSDISTKYGVDFNGSVFRGGYNDLHNGGWFLTAKKDAAGGSIEQDGKSWQNYNFDPNGKDKYKTYAQVAGQLLAAQGKLTPELANQLIEDAKEKMAAEQLSGAGMGGKEPIIPNGQPSNKESFQDFVTRYKSGNLDSGPVTSARTLEQPKPNMQDPVIKTMSEPKKNV